MQEESCTSYEQWDPPPLPNPGPQVPDVARELAGTEAFAWVDQVEAVMRAEMARGTLGFGGADVHPAVDLTGVHGDDSDRDPLRDREGEGGLAARAWADDRGARHPP